jgi:hypothetical protein
MDPFKLLGNSRKAIIAGYEKFPTSFFRVSLLNYPAGVVVIDRGHLREYFEDSERNLSFFEAAVEDMDFENTLPGNIRNLYHVPVIRNQLTQNIARILPILAEELGDALKVEIEPLLGADWTPIVIYEKSLKLVARTVYRGFVGLPLCRDEKFLDAAIENATQVAQMGQLLVYFPKFIRP